MHNVCSELITCKTLDAASHAAMHSPCITRRANARLDQPISGHATAADRRNVISQYRDIIAGCVTISRPNKFSRFEPRSLSVSCWVTVLTVAPSTSVVVERVANYSSVTARESLENLRRRQQQQQERRRRTGLLMSDDIDTTYDTIDYDLINSVTFRRW